MITIEQEGNYPMFSPTDPVPVAYYETDQGPAWDIAGLEFAEDLLGQVALQRPEQKMSLEQRMSYIRQQVSEELAPRVEQARRSLQSHLKFLKENPEWLEERERHRERQQELREARRAARESSQEWWREQRYLEEQAAKEAQQRAMEQAQAEYEMSKWRQHELALERAREQKTEAELEAQRREYLRQRQELAARGYNIPRGGFTIESPEMISIEPYQTVSEPREVYWQRLAGLLGQTDRGRLASRIRQRLESRRSLLPRITPVPGPRVQPRSPMITPLTVPGVVATWAPVTGGPGPAEPIPDWLKQQLEKELEVVETPWGPAKWGVVGPGALAPPKTVAPWPGDIRLGQYVGLPQEYFARMQTQPSIQRVTYYRQPSAPKPTPTPAYKGPRVIQPIPASPPKPITMTPPKPRLSREAQAALRAHFANPLNVEAYRQLAQSMYWLQRGGK
jgi:hypothetical protein